MTIVKVQVGSSGKRAIQSQSHRTSNWMGEEWVEVPENLVPILEECGGYCDLQIEDGVLVGITHTERPEPEPEPYAPTTEERLSALEGAMLSMMGVSADV